jgi:hypothetical protein
LKKWLEFQFDETMSWENYGESWHIDHIIPINSFNFKNDLEKKLCFNWKNLQPLESKENIDKSDNIQIKYIEKLLINLTKFVPQETLNKEYQELRVTLIWLREKLRYGNNFQDEELLNKIIHKMDNPQLNTIII